ncbi:MAG: acylneuraminate cytidylyltransferase family protein [Alphaproteobacteria bacterium]
MFKNKTFLSIIPARGGSKRLPRKNVLDLCGKPLISWTIEAALNSKYLDEVVVTSDDIEILGIANNMKVMSIERPSHLASDTASTFDAVKHTIDNIDSYEYIVLLQPTSPLRNATHIDKAIELLEKKDADAVISVTNINHNPALSNTLDESLSMKNFINEEYLKKCSEDLDKYYKLNGAIYICKTKKLLEEKSFFLRENIFAFIMSATSSVDIDKKEDFEFANLYLSKKI